MYAHALAQITQDYQTALAQAETGPPTRAWRTIQRAYRDGRRQQEQAYRQARRRWWQLYREWHAQRLQRAGIAPETE